ncbi:DUF1330 domain-containing protein [Antrihabitans cavernicola]|uniref:DUF1330 domain-containing protein n=1 Tax=Antrihabitans cavernicola TaxID=2495913 RepID=A0A5A7S5T2_9NOCA|nr:DUF1330 domain-containing protein [Spelaeibacter cavernicola]KAA0017364.1 DUF1330 domain-containing protein [Spelaeibacter cavernicola]
MSVYWVSYYHEIRDEQKMAAYAELAGPALREAGGTILTRGDSEHHYEHGGPGKVVIIEFASMEAAVAAHDSAAYQHALTVLDDGVVREIRFVPGID